MQTVNGNWATCLIFNIYYFWYGYIFTSECMPLIYDWQSEMQAVYKWQPAWRFAVCIEATHRDKLVVCVSNENGQWVCHELAMTMMRHTHQFNKKLDVPWYGIVFSDACTHPWVSNVRWAYCASHRGSLAWMLWLARHRCWHSRVCPYENVFGTMQWGIAHSGHNRPCRLDTKSSCGSIRKHEARRSMHPRIWHHTSST